MKTGIVTTDTYLIHDTGRGHPERADRVTVVIDHLKKVKSKNLIWKKPAKFDLKYLEYAHDKNYLDNVKNSFPKQGLNFLNGDTIVSPGSKEATRDAVGSILTAIDGVIKKDFNNAFCAVRPPGHHASKDQYGGYCFFNNVAIAAESLKDKGAEKIFILDIDFHHGNGTQDIFYERSDIFFSSLHGDPKEAFPHFLGHANETGEGQGEGFNINYPMQPGTPYDVWTKNLDDAMDKADIHAQPVAYGVLSIEKGRVNE